jgi:predicted type IV restriction endonuclease
MKEMLEDLISKLTDGYFVNEEHVRLSLVTRVLQHLGWDIWNPREVNPEYYCIPNEDRSRVDIALFLTPKIPSAFF